MPVMHRIEYCAWLLRRSCSRPCFMIASWRHRLPAAAAGLEVQSLGCDGADSFLDLELRLREVAVAVARSVTQADATCETSGGPDTVACGFTSGSINSIATAHVRPPPPQDTRSMPPFCSGCKWAIYVALPAKLDVLLNLVARTHWQ